jgi:tetratricopeptide (TPR) repeat protein
MQERINELLQQGIAAAKAGQAERARQNLLKVTDLDETNTTAWLWLSTVVPEVDDKLTCFNNVLAIDPDNKQALRGLKMLQQQAVPANAHPEKTVCPFCDQAISSMDSTCPHCQTPLVMECPACTTPMDVEWDTCTECGYEMGDYRYGSVYFTQLAMSYREHRRSGRAMEALRIAEKLDPDQPDLYRQMGEVLTDMSEPAAAISMLEQAVEKEPEQIGPYLALGKVLRQEGRWEQAETVYRKAMEVAPKSSEPYFALGDLLFHQSKNNEARKQLQQATRLDPQHGEAWARLGQVYESQQKYASAGVAYQRAIKYLHPDSLDWPLAKERVQVLSSHTGCRNIPVIGRLWG